MPVLKDARRLLLSLVCMHEEEKDKSFVLKAFWKRKKKKTKSNEGVVRSSIRNKMEW
jgi:hypothetical protein